MTDDTRHYTVADVNPRSATAKGIEMTVLRALELIAAFDELADGADWTAVPNPTYRRIIGEQYKHGRVIEECWKRYKDGTIYRQVEDLHRNLPPTAQQRPEIAAGMAKLRKRADEKPVRSRRVRPSR